MRRISQRLVRNLRYPDQPRIGSDIVDKVLEIRKKFQMGPVWIKWYLERYYDIKVSDSSVYRSITWPLLWMIIHAIL